MEIFERQSCLIKLQLKYITEQNSVYFFIYFASKILQSYKICRKHESKLDQEICILYFRTTQLVIVIKFTPLWQKCINLNILNEMFMCLWTP